MSMQTRNRFVMVFMGLYLAACAPDPYVVREAPTNIPKEETEQSFLESIKGQGLIANASQIDGHVVALNVPRPEWPRERGKLPEEGSVSLLFLIDTNGAVERVVVEHSAGALLDQSCLDAVKAWRFQPMTRGGVPVKVPMGQKFDFSFKKEEK